MSIPSYLANIKSAGVYRYVFDKSIVPTEEQQTLRLVVGYSEKGPFNTPVYIANPADFIKTFGGISRRMERKGIFFNRMALHALQAGPILVLNIKPFNVDSNNPETTQIVGFNGCDLAEDAKGIASHGPVGVQVASTSRGERDRYLATVYDTNRFWNVDASRLWQVDMGSTNGGRQDYMRIVQTSTFDDSCTIFVRPYVPSSYDVKISEWYSAETSDQMPPYLDAIKDCKLNEFFAEIYVFKGNLNDPGLFASTGTLGTRLPAKFDYWSDGVMKSVSIGSKVYGITNETAQGGTRIITSAGTFKEGTKNVVRNILVLAADSTTYDYTALMNKTGNKVKLVNGNPDMTGKNANKIVILSAAGVEDLTFAKRYDNTVACWDDTYNAAGSLTDAGKWPVLKSVKIDGVVKELVTETVENNKPKYTVKTGLTLPSGFALKKIGPNDVITVDSVPVVFVEDVEVAYEAYPWPAVSVHFAGELPTKLDEEFFTWQPFCVFEDGRIKSNPNFINAYGDKVDALRAMSGVSTSNFVGSYGGIMLPGFKNANGSFISLDQVFNSDYRNHKMLMGINEQLLEDALDMDENGDYEWNGAESQPDVHGIPSNNVANYVHALCSAIKYETVIGQNHPATVTYDSTSGVYGQFLAGYIYNSIKRSEKGASLVNKILDVLYYKGINEALTNNVDVDYHYLIDTFQSYSGRAIKTVFGEIAMAKDNALALVNFPPMGEIMKAVGTADYKGGWSMEQLRNADAGISLPTEAQGASWMAFYTQLTLTDGGGKFVVPSAALVSNLFMDKYSKTAPYYPVAGPNYGTISVQGLVGPDYNYARKDLDVLEPMGVNAIVHIPRYGVVINSNQTAKQTPVSALSKVHVRELVIYLQNEIEFMLRGYQWDLNTSALRDRIKARADGFLERVKANGGVYKYVTKCDDENNTPEVIDNEMVILDVEIEPARAAGKMVQTLTIHRTGGIKSA